MTLRQLEAAVEALSMRLAGDLSQYEIEMGGAAGTDDLHAAHSALAAQLGRRRKRK